MVRTAKQSVTSQSAPVVPATPVADQVEKPVKKTVQKKSKDVVSKEEPKEVVAPVVPTSVDTVVQTSKHEPVEVADEVTDSTDAVESNIFVKLADFSLKIQAATNVLSSLKIQYKNLEKVVVKELKAAQKTTSRKNKRTGNRQPSGFIKPCKITDELALFLNKQVGTEMARTSVSKEINQYIRSNNLQDKDNGRKINPDANLTKLLRLQPTDELTYFNLQRYMKSHFIKTDAAAAPVVV
jgi:chromatin remodeling complex protein RSC6